MVGNLYTVTAEDVEHWPKPNYVNPVNRDWLPTYAIVWQSLATILVFGRLHLRITGKSGSFGFDDALIFIAWCFSVAFTASSCVSVWHNEMGRHVWDIERDKYSGALYVMFLFSTAATKISILLFYRRMVKDTFGRAWIYTVWVLLFISVGSTVSISIAYGFMCTPLSVYWDIHTLEALGQKKFNCLDGDAMTIATGVITIASDFWTAALPCAMFQVHNIGISKRQRRALNIIFCLGFLVTGVGIARTYYLWEIGHNEDLSWVGYNLFATSIVEIQLAIICVCLPFVRAFFRRYLPDMTIRSQRTFGRSATTATDQYSSQITSHARDSFVPLESLEGSLDAGDKKSGVLVREKQTGMLKPVWTEKRSSLLHSGPIEYT